MEDAAVNYPWLDASCVPLIDALKKPFHPKVCGLLEPTELGVDQLALRLSTEILCESGTFPACHSCRSCLLLKEMTHPDHALAVLGPTNYQLEWIESLRCFIGSRPQISGRKVVMIPQIQQFHGLARSALLHLMETLPEHLYVFFTGRGSIAKRLAFQIQGHWLQLNLPELAMSLEWLREQVKGISFNLMRLKRWLDWSQGSPLLVKSRLTDQGVFAQEDELVNVMSEQIVHPAQMRHYLDKIDQITSDHIQLGLHYAIEAWRRQFGCACYSQSSWSLPQLEFLNVLQTKVSSKSLVRAVEQGAVFDARMKRIPALHHPLLRRSFLNVVRTLRGMY